MQRKPRKLCHGDGDYFDYVRTVAKLQHDDKLQAPETHFSAILSQLTGPERRLMGKWSKTLLGHFNDGGRSRQLSQEELAGVEKRIETNAALPANLKPNSRWSLERILCVGIYKQVLFLVVTYENLIGSYTHLEAQSKLHSLGYKTSCDLGDPAKNFGFPLLLVDAVTDKRVRGAMGVFMENLVTVHEFFSWKLVRQQVSMSRTWLISLIDVFYTLDLDRDDELSQTEDEDEKDQTDIDQDSSDSESEWVPGE